MDAALSENRISGTKTKDTPVKRPLSLGVLPEDFVLHRAGKGNDDIVSSRSKDRENELLEFDIDGPDDDDFDIEVKFD